MQQTGFLHLAGLDPCFVHLNGHQGAQRTLPFLDFCPSLQAE
jgi:hypothetical protein